MPLIFILHHLLNLLVDRFLEDIVLVYHGLQVLPSEGASDCSIYVNIYINLFSVKQYSIQK